jgi:hypothetical protein
MKKYVWAPERHMKGDPMLIGRELDKLQRQNRNVLSARLVLDVARDEANPLHPSFEWDDSKAAELHRIDQARHLISSIRVITEQPRDGEKPVLHRVFVNLSDPHNEGDEEARGYVTVAKVLSQPELFERARQQFLKDLEAFERRYREFDGLTAPLQKVRETVQQLGLTEAVPA